MPMQDGDITFVRRGSDVYKATQQDLLGDRLWREGPVVADCNDAIENGWYRALVGAGNLPVASNIILSVDVFQRGQWVVQHALAPSLWSPTDSAAWVRIASGGAWQPWKKLALFPEEQTGTGGGGGPEYVLKAGDRMSGPLSSGVTNNWVFVANSKPGTNDSGLYCNANSDYIFALRDGSGNITVDINSLGDGQLNALLLRSLAQAGVSSPVWVDGNGRLVRGTAPDLTGYVAKTGDTMSGTLANSQGSGWVFVANSKPGVNESGLYATGDDNVVLGLRNAAGVLTFDVKSQDGIARGNAFAASGVKGQWAYFFASAPRTNDSGFFIAADGEHELSLRGLDGSVTLEVLTKTGQVRGKTFAALSEVNRWAYYFASAPNINDSGFAVDGDGNHEMILRDNGGNIAFSVICKESIARTGTFSSYSPRDQWAFIASSIPGTNDSGIFVDANGDYELALRDTNGDIVFSASTRRGEALAKTYTAVVDAGDWAYVFATVSGVNDSGFRIDADGNNELLLINKLGGRAFFVDSKNDIVRCGTFYSYSHRGQWAYLFASAPGTNDSGFFVAADGHHELILRGPTGLKILDVNSATGDIRGRGLALGDDSGNYNIILNGGNGEGTFNGAVNVSDLRVRNQGGAGVAPAALDANGNLVRGTGPDLSGYVAKAGDIMTGPLESRATGNWAFVGNSKPGINPSGLYCNADSDYIFALRDGSGNITVDINSLGDAQLKALKLRGLAQAGASAPVWVDSNGVLARGAAPDLTPYIVRTGDTMSGTLANSQGTGWAFVTNSKPGVNESGLFAVGDGNVTLGLRSTTGDLTFNVNSSDGVVRAGAFVAKGVKSQWAFLVASVPGTNDSGVLVGADGRYELILRALNGSSTFTVVAESGEVYARSLTLRDAANTNKVILNGTTGDGTLQRDLTVNGNIVTNNVQARSQNGGPLAGVRNLIVNGSFEINQRNRDINSVAIGEYGPDRWKRTTNGMTQVIESGNFIPGAVYTLSGIGLTTQQLTSPSSGHWTLPEIWSGAREIQLELGPVSTPYERIPLSMQFTRCLRYYQLLQAEVGGAVTSGVSLYGQVFFTTPMRAAPTLVFKDVAIVGNFDTTVPAIANVRNAWSVSFHKTATATGGGAYAFSIVADAEL